MSGDSFKPEEGGEVEVINPDLGNNEIDAQPAEGDAYDAAESEAMKDFTSIDDEAKEEEVESEEVTEDPQAEEDQAAPETQDEEEPEEIQAGKWDGNPATLPEELKETYQSMLRDYHSKTREVAEERKRAQDLQAKLLLKLSGDGSADAKIEEGPPPLPTGDDITQDTWNAAVTAQNAWFAEQNLKKLQESERFVPAEKFAEEQQKAYTAQIVKEVESLPGYNPEVERAMLDAMVNDPFWASAPNSREGMMALADKAISYVASRGKQTAADSTKEAKIKEQATAASRASPRVTTPKGATQEDVFSREFKNENERFEHAERIALEEFGT